MMNSPDYVTNGEATDSVRFAPLYALVIHLGQLLVCVLCLGAPGTASGGGGKRGVLLTVALLAALLCLWCALYPWRSCSLPSVGPVRAAGFAVVSFGACLCYVRDTDFLSAGSHWRDQTVFFPVAAGLFLLGAAGGFRAQRRAAEAWGVLLQGAGLDDALQDVVGLGEMLLVQEALGGAKEGARQRAEGLLAMAAGCRSAPALGLLLVRFEEQILAERLRFDFLISRDEWRSLLLSSSSEEGGVSYDQVAQGARALRGAIRPHAPLAVVNKHLVAMVFVNHLPEYVAWEVFRFMYDVTPLVRILQPLLLDTVLLQRMGGWGARQHALGLLHGARAAERSLRQDCHAAIDASAQSAPPGKAQAQTWA
jgi:hypothetical protein